MRMTKGIVSFAFVCLFLLPHALEAATIPASSTLEEVDLNSSGARFADTHLAAISSDASVVVFLSYEPFTLLGHLYLRNRLASSTIEIGHATTGNNFIGGGFTSMSGDGRVVAYELYDTLTSTYNLYAYESGSAKLIASNSLPMAHALSGDGRYLIYTYGRTSGEVRLLDRSNGQTTTIAAGSLSYEAPTITPDGRFAAFDSYDSVQGLRNVMLYDAQTAITSIAFAGQPALIPYYPSISDDGNTIAFQVYDSRGVFWYEGVYHAYILNRSTNAVTDAGRGVSDINPNSLSGDGRFLLYQRNGVYAFDRTSASTTLAVGSDNGISQNVPISKDGKWIAFETCDGPLSGTGTFCVNFHTYLISNPFLPAASSTAATSTPPAACTMECNSNVLFLPGIESSRLYGSNDNKLWEPFGDQDVRDLYLSEAGQGLGDGIYAKEGGIIDESPFSGFGLNIYKSFIEKMDQLKTNGDIVDWEPVAYDWRLSLDDLMNYGNDVNGRIYYTGSLRSTSTPYVIQQLRRLAATSRTGKVTIIAHSNGGLVAKRLTDVLGSEASQLIDKMIFVAVPQAGTPEAVFEGLHGSQIGPLGINAHANVTRAFASTSPMFYHLLPSDGYFTYVDQPVVTFDSSLPNWIARYGSKITTEGTLKNFLTDSYGRVDAETGPLNQPVQLKTDLLANAQILHDDLDNWAPPEGVQLIQIAGWGVPTTKSGIKYSQNKDGNIAPEAVTTIDGDGTVVVPSALWTPSTIASDYWVNLRAYNSENPDNFGPLEITHARILEVPSLISFLEDNILNAANSVGTYAYLSNTSPVSTSDRLKYELHSPLSLDAYDDLGNHTGVSTTSGAIEENIPGTYYDEVGDVKYIYTETDKPLHIVMDGYATSTFTFEVEELHGDAIVATTTWKEMPTTPNTLVRLDSPSDIYSLSTLNIDIDGDGTNDYMLPAKMDGVVTIGYRWDGFAQPINDTAHQIGESLSVFKAGSTVPVKFQLKKPDGTIVQAPTDPVWLSPQKGAAMSSQVGESIYTDLGTAGNSFKWDPIAQQYIYNWSTKGLIAGFWYKLLVQLDDGSFKSVIIGLK